MGIDRGRWGSFYPRPREGGDRMSCNLLCDMRKVGHIRELFTATLPMRSWRRPRGRPWKKILQFQITEVWCEPVGILRHA